MEGNFDELARKTSLAEYYESLIKRILKQFKDTSAHNLSIRSRVCARMAVSGVSSLVESMIRGYHEYKLICNDPIL